MSFIVDYAKDWALDKASGYLKTGIQAGGTLAGNAVGGVGSTIENGGRSFGEGSKFYASSLPFRHPIYLSELRLISTSCHKWHCRRG